MPAPVLLLLRAIEGAMREGLLLDEAIGGILDAALRVQDAAAVGLLPAGGAPPLTRAGTGLIAMAAEQRLSQHLGEVLQSGRAARSSDSGITFIAAPVIVTDQVRAVFGAALAQAASAQPEGDETVRAFARVLGHVLERDRTLAALVKRREEAVALFELASGALHAMKADEVIRMTCASLARELELDHVSAWRYDPQTREVEEVHAHESRRREAATALSGLRPIAQEDLLARCLAQKETVYAETETGAGNERRRKIALPVATPDTFFGFLVLSRRGSLNLAPQQTRLAEGLARIAAGALEKARLLELEQRENERIAFLSRLQKALANPSDPAQIARVAVGEIAARFDLDLCAIRILPAGELPAGSATYARPEGGIVPDGVPDALVKRLAAPGTWVALQDVLADPDGVSLAPAPAALRRLERPIGLVGVPIVVKDEVAGVLAGAAGGRPQAFDARLVRAFESVASELGHAIEAARTLLRERESARFLDRLREAQRAMSTTFDAARIKQTLAEQCVALLKADAAHVWEADAERKLLVVAAHAGNAFGSTNGSNVAAGDETHPVNATLRKGSLLLLSGAEVAALHPELAGESEARAAVTPLLYGDQPAGVLSVVTRMPAPAGVDELASRIALLADVGAIALHNARTMKLLEQQTERDPLTGLYRKDAILRRLDAEIRRAERTGRAVAIANLRLDGLADAIQKMGPSFGDQLLPKASAQIVHVTRAGNLVGRDRSDRFLIVLFDATRAQAQKAAEAIQRNFDGSFEPRLAGSGIQFTLSVGLAAYPEDAFDAPSLVLRAEEALDDAVRAGPGSIHMYGALSEDETGTPM